MEGLGLQSDSLLLETLSSLILTPHILSSVRLSSEVKNFPRQMRLKDTTHLSASSKGQGQFGKKLTYFFCQRLQPLSPLTRSLRIRSGPTVSSVRLRILLTCSI